MAMPIKLRPLITANVLYVCFLCRADSSYGTLGRYSRQRTERVDSI